MTTPAAIMHDQEPLDFDLWSKQDFADHWNWLIERYNHNAYHRLPNKVDSQIAMHLRGVTDKSSNLYDNTLLVHSEQNSDQIVKYQSSNFIPVYYWSHALIAVDWFRYAEHDPLIKYHNSEFNKDFLIYNRAWSGSREYRLKFTELLADFNLVGCANTAFSEYDSDVNYQDYTFKNAQFSIVRSDLHKLYPPNLHPSTASADYNSHDYASSAIEIVLETLFDDTRWHLTEKTLRPIACGKPFILASTPGSLQYLQNYGFETFGKYIDESYDSIVDPVQRLCCIATEMKRIASMPTVEKNKLWQVLHVIAARNKQRFFDLGWQKSIEQEFYTNLDQAMQAMNQTCTGKFWYESLSMSESSGSNGRSVEDIVFLKNWLKERN